MLLKHVILPTALYCVLIDHKLNKYTNKCRQWTTKCELLYSYWYSINNKVIYLIQYFTYQMQHPCFPLIYILIWKKYSLFHSTALFRGKLLCIGMLLIFVYNSVAMITVFPDNSILHINSHHTGIKWMAPALTFGLFHQVIKNK